MTATTGRQQGLEGKSVAITGRMASMVREEAVRRIHDAGGRFDTTPVWSTAMLVIGEGGPPLGDDGRLTRSLRRARRLLAEGTGIELLSEAAFLARLGLDERVRDLDRLYTTAQLARILGVPQGDVRAWIRHQLVVPLKVVNRLCWFDFQQVATARRLSDLTRAGVHPARLRRSLAQLESWLPSIPRALAQLERLEQDGPMVVRLDDGRLAEPSGQLRLDFEPPGPAPATIPLRRGGVVEWFEQGVAAEEEGRLEDARVAYEQALTVGDAVPEICFNLGNVLYALDRHDEATQRFRQAIALEPDYVEAWNNLGNTLASRGLHAEAMDAYRRALAAAPDYADAHFNLAETYAALKRRAEARRHWQEYLRHDPTSAWAQCVRERLADCDIEETDSAGR